MFFWAKYLKKVLTAKVPAVDFLRLSTLRETKHSCPFLLEFPRDFFASVLKEH